MIAFISAPLFPVRLYSGFIVLLYYCQTQVSADLSPRQMTNLSNAVVTIHLAVENAQRIGALLQ